MSCSVSLRTTVVPTEELATGANDCHPERIRGDRRARDLMPGPRAADPSSPVPDGAPRDDGVEPGAPRGPPAGSVASYEVSSRASMSSSSAGMRDCFMCVPP